MHSDYKLSLSSAEFIRFLVWFTLALICLSTIGQFILYFLPDFPFRNLFAQLFSLDEESNIPALFSGFLLFVCSFLLFVVGQAKKKEQDPDHRYWLGLGSIFLFLTVDELCSIHERTVEPMRALGFDSGLLYYSWIILAIPILLLIGLIFLRFLLRLPRKTRNGFLLSALIYIGGAVIVEAIAGLYDGNFGNRNFTYSLLFTLEESFEMFGTITFIRVMLKYIARIKIDIISLNLLSSPKFENP